MATVTGTAVVASLAVALTSAPAQAAPVVEPKKIVQVGSHKVIAWAVKTGPNTGWVRACNHDEKKPVFPKKKCAKYNITRNAAGALNVDLLTSTTILGKKVAAGKGHYSQAGKLAGDRLAGKHHTRMQAEDPDTDVYDKTEYRFIRDTKISYEYGNVVTKAGVAKDKFFIITMPKYEDQPNGEAQPAAKFLKSTTSKETWKALGEFATHLRTASDAAAGIPGEKKGYKLAVGAAVAAGLSGAAVAGIGLSPLLPVPVLGPVAVAAGLAAGFAVGFVATFFKNNEDTRVHTVTSEVSWLAFAWENQLGKKFDVANKGQRA